MMAMVVIFTTTAAEVMDEINNMGKDLCKDHRRRIPWTDEQYKELADSETRFL